MLAFVFCCRVYVRVCMIPGPSMERLTLVISTRSHSFTQTHSIKGSLHRCSPQARQELLHKALEPVSASKARHHDSASPRERAPLEAVQVLCRVLQVLLHFLSHVEDRAVPTEHSRNATDGKTQAPQCTRLQSITTTGACPSIEEWVAPLRVTHTWCTKCLGADCLGSAGTASTAD